MSVENHDSDKPEESTADANEAQATEEASVPELTEVEQLQQQLAEAQAKADEHWDQLLRARAEVENTRKRVEREMAQTRKYGLESIARELLPIHDSLTMGVGELEKDTASLETAREGMQLISQMMGKLMEQFSIQPIDPAGESFDPEAHQAMSMQESAEQAPNTVLQVLQKGYRLHDRVLRPAMVIVAKAPEISEAAEGDSEGHT